MKAYGKTDVGQKRNTNQDYLFLSNSPVGSFENLYIVADGMGGHKAGDHASSLSVQRFVEIASNCGEYNPVAVMRKVLGRVNAEIYQEAHSIPEYSGMGTTFVGLTVMGGKGYIMNVGDSRLYQLKPEEEIKQITMDHSLVEELVRQGALTPNEAKKHPRKNIITKAVGVDEEVIPDFFEVDVEQGDMLLLCSDGLSNMVDDEEMQTILTTNMSVEEKVQRLIDKANYYGGYDNIAVIVVEMN